MIAAFTVIFAVAFAVSAAILAIMTAVGVTVTLPMVLWVAGGTLAVIGLLVRLI